MSSSRLLAGVAILATIFAARTAAAAPRPKIADVCPGCVATAPDGTEPAPLLVVLHGDWGPMAPELHATWERFAAPRKVALLSLACPTALGCKGSWWRWNGDPAWVTEQVDRFAEKRAVDRSRVWIAGWSGGASYIGLRTQELERTFAAIVIHGGGIRPMQGGCASAKPPVVFLVGDKNPLHELALGLRAHYESCGNEIAFHLVPGGEHTAEWKALDARGPEIMDRLAKATRAAPAPPPSASDASAAPALSPLPDASAPPPPSASAASSAAPSVPPRAGCGCHAAPRDPRVSLAALAAALALVAIVSRRSRGASPRSPTGSCGGAPSCPRSRSGSSRR
jgi:predicted esterase